MKKIYTLITISAIALGANAQQKSLRTGAKNVHELKVNPSVHLSAAVGDTLMYMPFPETYVVDPNDNSAFQVEFEDVDALTPNNAGADMDWALYYSTDSSLNGSMNPTNNNYYHPWEDSNVDSAFFISATSWFNPAGQANNWFMFGPITLAEGGILKWYDRTNPGYRDGYKVYATTSASSPITFSDFADAPFYTKLDASPSPTAATDTTWVLRTAVIPPAYEMQSVYIGFQHDANDMDVLYLDEILMVAAGLGINENAFVNGVKVAQNSPNPFSNVTTVNYELQKSANVAFEVYDLTGKKVAEQTEGNQVAGRHALKFNADQLPAGVYYYSLVVNKAAANVMKMVVIK
ncbi:MAG: T9SS type A sorting domain-containing protein [Bacteroidia bacterium]|jgi:hypothetical protein